MKNFKSRLGWGIFLLVIAALVLINHFGGFVELGVWSVLGAALALAVIVSAIANLSFGGLPFPLALLYYIFQIPLGLPIIGFWTLLIVALISSIGLTILLPKKTWSTTFGAFSNISSNHFDDWEDDSEDDPTPCTTENVEEAVGDDRLKNKENNPRIGVTLGEASRYLHATALKTAAFRCRFGSLAVYFDQATLHPNGAEAFVECSFGSVELYVPRHWRIINKTNCSFGATEIDNGREVVSTSPALTVSGNVSFGALEIFRT